MHFIKCFANLACYSVPPGNRTELPGLMSWLSTLWAKIVHLKKTESHKWETVSESTESIERSANRLSQTDIRIHLRDKSFHLWDSFEGGK